MADRIHDWQNGAPRYRGLEKKPQQRVPDDVEEHHFLTFANYPGRVRVYLANKDTGDTLELPHDSMVVLFVNKDVAQTMRDDLLDPSEFPDTV